ncbi:MAG: M1 family metallopeptidase [Bacteroidota bacterium]
MPVIQIVNLRSFKLVCCVFFALLFAYSNALSQSDNYFQQDVNYKISVALNDESHTLKGNIEIEYTNNSPDELSFIYFHLWPNAYKSLNTAFATQQVENGNVAFFYSTPDERGYIDGLDFKVNGQKANWEYDQAHIDIAFIRLNAPLKSGETINISTPFEVKIPESFSRLGHVGQSYQISQWYPKPAVYDKNGWHQMPYLDTGEFYSEFGSFEVSITLPENYIVGATGVLQESSEEAWLLEKAGETASKDLSVFEAETVVPVSSTKKKTITYKAENVHDFAWFADKTFFVLKGNAQLESGRQVDTWAMFPAEDAYLWRNSIDYINRSLQFFSEQVGEYPWPQYTAVRSSLGIGSAMEYPMITVVEEMFSDKDLDEVIAHEIAHNWFYGVLGSNERNFPWMDEGMTTYYEEAYISQYYGAKTSLAEYLGKPLGNLLDAEDDEMGYSAFLYQSRINRDQSMAVDGSDLTDINYFINSYERGSTAMYYLRAYMGEDVFDNAIKKYYETWKFKHPEPEDLHTSMEEETNRDLDWFFDELLGAGIQMDYALQKVSNGTITVKNLGNTNGPFSVSGIKDDKVVATEWYEGFEGVSTLSFPEGNYDNVIIDAFEILPEINRRNNYQKRKLAVSLIGDIENPKKKTVYIAPLIGGNSYDKFLIGLGIYNSFIPSKKFEIALAPMFGTGPKDITGLADVRYHILPERGFAKRVTIGSGLRSFHFASNESISAADLQPVKYFTRYTRITPSIEFEFREKRPRNQVTRLLSIKSKNIIQEAANLGRDTIPHPNFPGEDSIFVAFFGKESEHRVVNEISYSHSRNSAINPYSFKVAIEQYTDRKQEPRDQSYVKLSLEGNYRWNFKENRGVRVRLYGAGFVYNGAKSDVDTLGSSFGAFPVSLISQGQSDYHFDNVYFGRGEQNGVFSQQIYLDQGGFKTPLSSVSEGTSNKLVVALNLKSDLPVAIPIPIRPYLDFGYFRETRRSVLLNDVSASDQIFFNGGLALELGEGVFGIYFPLFSSQNLNTQLKSRGDYLKRISFTLNLDLANPLKLAKNITP